MTSSSGSDERIKRHYFFRNSPFRELNVGLGEPVWVREEFGFGPSLTLSPLFTEPVYKSSCALTMHAISHYSPDVMKAHAGVALPLAFLGMHQAAGPDEETGESHDAKLWAEVWQDNVPGEEKHF